MRAVDAAAPVRLDLSGGTLDIWPIHLVLPEPGVTVNVALDLPARVRIRPAPPGDASITLASRDLGREESHADAPALAAALAAGRSALPLLGQALLAAGVGGGLRLETRAESPAGAGLGGSSALLAAVLGALGAARDRPLDPEGLCGLAQDVETRLLGTATGYQDYRPPVHGGLLALEGRPGGLVVERLPVSLEALAARLRLVYTGAPHVSGVTNWGVVRAFFDGEPATVAALERLAAIARAQRRAFRAGDLDAALGATVEDGAARRAMAPGVTTPVLDAIDQEVRAAGARGTKICGAGGGGSLLVVLPDDPDAAARVDAAIAAGPGRPLPVRLPAGGLVLEAAGPAGAPPARPDPR